MPLRRRTTSRAEADPLPPSAPEKPLAGQGVATAFLCNMVKPRCVEYRNFCVQTEMESSALVFHITEAVSVSNKRDSVLNKHYRIAIDKSDLGPLDRYRIIGKPIVIGCRAGHMILQCTVEKLSSIVFVYLNTDFSCGQLIEDNIHYFPRDVVLMGSVECYISPDTSYALFCLPQVMRTPVKNCKVLMTPVTHRKNGIPLCDPIMETNMGITKYSVFAFNPRKRCEVSCLKLDCNCCRCSISLDNPNGPPLASQALGVRKMNRLMEFIQPKHLDSQLRSCEGLNSEDVTIQHCDFEYSKAGDIAFFTACNLINESRRLQIRCVFFETETWDVIKNVWFFLDTFPVDDMSRSFFVGMSDVTDSKFYVKCYTRGRLPVTAPYCIRIPRALSLQDACRFVIRQACLPSLLEKLPLPEKLLAFIQHKHILL